MLLPLALATSIPTLAQATEWPTRPIKILVGYSAGGGADGIARMLAESMSKSLRQSVIVENRPGAGTTLAASLLSKAPPDGYTLMLMSSANTIAPEMYKSLSYNALTDFTMIGTVARGVIYLAVPKTSGITTLGQLIEQAKKHPGRLNYGAGGIGTTAHLSALVLQKEAGIKMTHIPYKGGNDTAVALVGGQIDVQFGTPPAVASIAGRANLLAVTSGRRSPQSPDVPAISETLRGFDIETWYALAAPAGISKDVVAKLATALQVALGEDKLRKQLLTQGVEASVTTPAATQTFYADELRRWSAIVRQEGLHADN